MGTQPFSVRIGMCLLALVSLSAARPDRAAAQAPAYLTQWGTEGSGSGQFHDPWHIAADHEGNVYVGDYNTRIQKFSSTGAFLTQWGSFGGGDGQFGSLPAPATDAAGNVYVCDYAIQRIQKFTANGTFLSGWAVPSPNPFTPNIPRALTVDAAGAVYVAYSNFDTGIPGIWKFSGTGVLLTTWSFPRFSAEPGGLATDAAGTVYATRGGYIQKFTGDGAFLTQWGSATDDIHGIAIDVDGNVVVSDVGHDRMLMYTTGGTLLAQWGSFGSGDGQFNDPRGVAVDAHGNVYVVDSVNQRVQKFGPLPTPAKSLTWGRLKRMYR